MTALDPTTADRILTPPSSAWSSLAFGGINLVPAVAPNPVSASTGYNALDMLSDNGASDVASDAPMVPTGDFAMFIAITGPIGTTGWNLFWGDHWLDIELTATAVNYVGIGNHYFSTNPTLTTPLDADITVLAFRWDSVNGGAMHTSRDGLVGTDSTLMTPASGTVYMNAAPNGTKAEVLGAWLFESTTVDATTADDTIAAIMALFPDLSQVGAGGWGIAGAGVLTVGDTEVVPVVSAPPANGAKTPPVVPTPESPAVMRAAGVYPMRHVWETMPAPTLDVGYRPVNWEATDAGWDEYAYLQITVEGVDITLFDGVETPFPTWRRGEPFGSQSATIQLPQVHAFRPVPVWAAHGSNVSIRLVKIAGGTVSLFEGFVMDKGLDEDSGVFSLQCLGTLFGADLLLRPPSFTTAPQEIGTLIPALLNAASSRRWLTMASVVTGIQTSVAGGWEPLLTGYVQSLLATAISSGKQWTIACAERTPILTVKDTATIAATIRVGQRGIGVSLNSDATQAPNVIYGEGVNADGGRWRNAKFPNWKPDDTPAYPNTDPADTMRVGRTDASTDSGSGVSDFQRKLGLSTTGTYSTSDRVAVRAAQDRAGITVDGIVGPQSWAAFFDTGANTGTLDGAFIAPLAAATEVQPRLYGPDGDDLGPNANFNENAIRVEDKIDYGQGVSKAEGIKNALEVLARGTDPGWAGTVTFEMDPATKSKYELREGENLRILGGASTDITAHIAKISFDARAATLEVDTKARDYPTLEAIIARDRAATDPAKAAIKRLLAGNIPSDSPTYDAESPAGIMPRHAIFTNLWDVRRIPMGAFGTISRTRFTTTSATPFALAVFGKAVTAANLLAVVGNPLTTSATESPWSSAGDALDDMGLLQAWGWKEQPAGFYPRQYQNPAGATTAPVTGRLVDDASWDYASASSPWIWVATIASASCYVTGRFYGQAT